MGDFDWDNLTDEELAGIVEALTQLSYGGDAGFLGLGSLGDGRPPEVVMGDDGQMYRNNPQLGPNGWTTNPDYSEPVYYFHQPIEVGDALGIYAEYSDDYSSATQQGRYFTKDEIKAFWDGTFDTGTLNMDVFREQHPDMTFEDYFSFVQENSALFAQGYTMEDNPDMFSALTDKYGIQTSFTGESGHVYGWNGSNYTKTYHADKSFDLGGLIMSIAAGAMTGGLINSGALGSFLKGLSGFQKAAVINGITTAARGGGLKEIAGSMIGAYAGGQIAGIVGDLGSRSQRSFL